MLDDLVISSANDIGLKAYVTGELKQNELIFRKTKHFTYQNKRIDAWEVCDYYVVNDLKLMKIEGSIHPGARTNHPIDITRLWVKVLTKKMIQIHITLAYTKAG